MRFSKMLFGALSAAALLAAPTQAATFVLTNTGGAEVGTQARKGFDLATAYWSSVLTNDVAINLNIGFRSLGTGILGSTMWLRCRRLPRLACRQTSGRPCST
jgi:hypothetical protein